MIASFAAAPATPSVAVLSSSTTHRSFVTCLLSPRIRSFFLAFLVVAVVFTSSFTSTLSSSLSTGTHSVEAMSTAAVSRSGGGSGTATAAKKGALIFLHGLGDSPAGWSDLERTLPTLVPRLSNIRYVFPPAPTISISINGGATMPGWFDLYDWPIDVGSQDDPVGLKMAVSQIREAISKLETEEGISPSKIVVGGFSQGGAVALLTCFHPNLLRSGEDSAADADTTDRARPLPLAGCAGLSAWLTLPDQVVGVTNKDVTDVVHNIPLFWGHGRFDDKVLFPQQAFGVQKLRDWGVQDVDARDYPMGHSSHPQEMQALADFVDQCIFGGNDDDKEPAKATTKSSSCGDSKEL